MRCKMLEDQREPNGGEIEKITGACADIMHVVDVYSLSAGIRMRKNEKGCQ